MQLVQITPFVPCTSLKAQIGFYRDVLGFTLGYNDAGYAFLRRDKVAVRLVQVSADVDLQSPDRQSSFYIDVRDVDAVYAGMKPALDGLPEARVRAPFNQPYGQREFQVFDEDCTLVFFGEAVQA